MAEGQTITINGKEYALDNLSDKAKKQLANIKAADLEMKRLDQKKAFVQTARGAYAHSLQQELTKVEPQ